MASHPPLSPTGEIVRRHDPDRFFAALFAPADKRETLFTLYAFNHEIARAREVVREPFAALIRLQWWREVAEGARRRHEVAGPVGEALDEGRLHAPDLLAMIDGREAEADTIETLDAWTEYVRATAGGVAVAAGRALGASGPALDALRQLGAGCGVAGILRSVPAVARQGRCVLPADVLARHGLSPAAAMQDPAQDGVRAAAAELAALGRAWLHAGHAGRERGLLAAWLPAVIAQKQLQSNRYDTTVNHNSARIAMVAAAVKALLRRRTRAGR